MRRSDARRRAPGQYFRDFRGRARRSAGAAWVGAVLLLTLLAAAVVLWASTYTVDQAEQAVIVEFGAPVGDAVTEPGLHFKKPFIQEVRRFEKRLLAWDGDPNQIPTRGREFISVDTTARWRIADPLRFLQSLRDELGAQSRLDDVIDSVVRDHVSSTRLEEIVRSEGWRPPTDRSELERMGDTEGLMQEIEIGREKLTRQVLEEARRSVAEYGIELVDVRIKRINYIESVQRQVFERMISERQRIAAEFVSEGEGQSAEILGQMQKELATITSEAKRRAEVIRGAAEAEAARIFAEAFNRDPEFYAFYRTLESFGQTIDRHTTLIIGADSDYFRYLREVEPARLSRPPGQAVEASGSP